MGDKIGTQLRIRRLADKPLPLASLKFPERDKLTLDSWVAHMAQRADEFAERHQNVILNGTGAANGGLAGLCTEIPTPEMVDAALRWMHSEGISGIIDPSEIRGVISDIYTAMRAARPAHDGRNMAMDASPDYAALQFEIPPSGLYDFVCEAKNAQGDVIYREEWAEELPAPGYTKYAASDNIKLVELPKTPWATFTPLVVEEPFRLVSEHSPYPDHEDIEIMRDGWDKPRRLKWSQRSIDMGTEGLKWRPVK